MDNDTLLHLTTQIICAHPWPRESLAEQIKVVYTALATAGDVPAEVVKVGPAVNPLKSVFEDHIICLEDGLKFQTLKNHLMKSHGLTPDEYRRKWGLPGSYPMVAPSYSKKRSDVAKVTGLGLTGR